MRKFFTYLRRVILIGVALAVGILIVFGIYASLTDPDRQIWQFKHLHYEVTLRDDGSAAVSELRTFNFERGSYTFGEFDLAGAAEDILVLENGFAYTRLDDPLSSRPERHFAVTRTTGANFRVAWYYRARGPQERTFEIRYVIPQAALAYDDCIVYFQKFLSESNETKIEKITVGINLPEGVSPDNTKIFGHGPAYGQIDFAADNPRRVEMSVEKITPGFFVEARFLMPAGVLTSAPVRSGAVYDEILAEELAAAAKADRERFIGQAAWILALLLMASLLAGTILLRLRYKDNFRKLKPANSPPYLREAPSPLPPAIAANLFRFYQKKPDKAALISTCLLDLVSRRVLAVETGIVGKNEETFLRRLPGEPALLECEKPILEFLFRDVAPNQEQVSLRELQKFCRSQRNYSEINNLLTSFESRFKRLWSQYGFEEKQRNLVPGSLIGLRIAAAAALFFGLVLVVIELLLLAAAAWTLAAGGALALLFNIVFCHKRRMLTQKGEDELALWQALYRFFNELTAFEEKELPEIDLWEKLLVYAAALGVADKVVRQLQMRYPQLNDPYYMRQHLYVYAGLRFGSGAGGNSFAGLQNTLSSSFRSAQSVVTSRNSSSGSGGGFSGGGFSGGGGAGGSSGGRVG